MLIFTDIHGCFLTFKALLAKIPEDVKANGIVVCGDLIDRGPRSKEVVQYMIDNNIPVVRGNHEEFMINGDEYWMQNGGLETLRSYGPFTMSGLKNEEDRELFEAHKKWMSELPYFIEFPELKKDDGRYLVISHSSISRVWKHRDEPERTLEFQKHVTWNRQGTINDVPEIYNVFGHTVQSEPKIKVPFANIDTGACFNEVGYGKLTALEFPSMRIFQQENVD